MSAVRQPTDLEVVKQALNARTRAQFAVLFANQAVVALAPTDPRYLRATAALDQAMLNVGIGKWLLGRALGTHVGFAATTGDERDYRTAAERFEDARVRAESVRTALEGGRDPEFSDGSHRPRIAGNGTEILFADDVPVVPSICPIIVLQGSSFEMGRQYAQQAIEIYGRWIFAETARRIFSAQEQNELRQWEAELARHAPEIVEMARGMAAGSSEAGVPMEYDNALAIWTGAEAPATELRGVADDLWDGPLKQLMPTSPSVAARGMSLHVGGTLDELCSGLCAWGDATADGGLVVGASTDHDCTYQATVVAYPDDGHDFVYTPFGVNGRIPGWSNLFMAGHPGLNSEGVTYVHHGGVPYVGEPSEEWGYGVRRGAGTFHLLRHSTSAREALETQCGWPVGDAGQAMGTDGGFYADEHYAYVLETRRGHDGKPVLREHSTGLDGTQYDFLYANNNSLSPDAPQRNAVPDGDYQFDPVAGWHALDQDVLLKGTPGEQWRKVCTKLSEARNRFLFDQLQAANGTIDTTFVERLYSTPGELPEGSWDEISAAYEHGQWEASAAHRVNAFISVVDPKQRTYSGCIGPLTRKVQPNNPNHGFYYHDETNASWTLTLTDSPADLVGDAESRAVRDIDAAGKLLSASGIELDAGNELARRLGMARDELAAGRTAVAEGGAQADVGSHARALRAFTRVQVRARQVSGAIAPVAPL